MNARENFSHNILSEEREKLNHEILRRGTFKWWDPLCTPSVGQDRSSPLSLPDIGDRMEVDDHTYTIEENSKDSIEPTRNVIHPVHGIFPAGQQADRRTAVPNTSAAQINVDEMRNFLVGLTKMQDVNLYYGRDEQQTLAFRDPSGIYEAIENAQNSILNKPLHETDLPVTKNDPNGRITTNKHVNYPVKSDQIPYKVQDGKYYMPSGEFEGEEGPLNEDNFFDDHGAPIGEGGYHPFNPAYTPAPLREWIDHDNDRSFRGVTQTIGGTPSASFGPNPRNPRQVRSYPDRPVFGGVPTSCNVACTGLCSVTCDNQCSESCTTTCWARCGDACTSQCGNQCTSCSTQCFESCKTKCENNTGYSCFHAGAKAVKFYSVGGHDGIPGENKISAEYISCDGCSFTCQFFPNKRTTCWDAGCMGKCFVACENSCSTSCYGACINNDAEEGDNYFNGHGQGCSAGCTVNCVGKCEGTCQGYCVYTCWHSCKDTCADNCEWDCETFCGHGCESSCITHCTDDCTYRTNAKSCDGGCEALCRYGCNHNCLGIGCRSVCGVDSAGACDQNCRINCMAHSCTSICGNQCVDMCTTCVNTCDMQCGACSSQCSVGCEQACRITCSEDCQNSCSNSCLNNCSELCGGCTNLCYSCTGLCIGTCAFHCEVTCTNCTNQCSWWCDISCNRECFVNCSTFCITSCSGSCATFLMSETTHTAGPMRPPTAEGYQYPHPKNRWEERESFKLVQERRQYRPELIVYPLKVYVNDDRNLVIEGPLFVEMKLYQTSLFGGVFNIDQENGHITINEDMLTPEIEMNQPLVDSGEGIIIAIITTVDNQIIPEEEIDFNLPIGFSGHVYGVTESGKMIVVIERDIFLYPPENEEDRII